MVERSPEEAGVRCSIHRPGTKNDIPRNTGYYFLDGELNGKGDGERGFPKAMGDSKASLLRHEK